MYRELLSDLIRKVKWAQLQDPCSEQDIEAAEKVVGYPFPDELKDLLRETNGDRWFLLSAKEIIENVERNRAILSECFDPEEFLEKTVMAGKDKIELVKRVKVQIEGKGLEK